MTGNERELTEKLADVRGKYQQERDKRLGQTNRQSAAMDGDLAHYIDDPFAEVQPRDPVFDEVEVACIGAGFAGLLIAANARREGYSRIRLIDRAGDVGGVWYWNRYPEAKCDIESLCYLPLLEETGYIPKMRYSSATEIWEYCKRIARQFDLYSDALFHTGVTDLAWDESIRRWIIRTNRGDIIRAQYVAIGTGSLSQVKLPAIPGIGTFKGKSFHTSRWDYSYTGGGPEDPRLDRLGDKVVGFVGTGATGLQCVPPLGQSSKQLFVFQRTPSTVAVRANGPIDPDEIRALPPGWHKRRQENFTAIYNGLTGEADLVADGWTKAMARLRGSPTYQGLTGEALELEKERVDFELTEEIRARIDSIVTDKATADLLKPYYKYLCKRPGFHDEYLPAFNLPSVKLVDTEGRGVEQITERGVVAGGREYELDCLIFGTGFESEASGRLMLGFEVTGRNGLTLNQHWANGMRTLHGMTVSGFPNLFMVPLTNSQAVLTANACHMTVEYAQQIGYIVGAMRRRGAEVFELTAAAEQDWVDTILARRLDRRAFLEACTPGRFNYEGNVDLRNRQNTEFGGGPIEYFALLQSWREAETLPGMDVS